MTFTFLCILKIYIIFKIVSFIFSEEKHDSGNFDGQSPVPASSIFNTTSTSRLPKVKMYIINEPDEYEQVTHANLGAVALGDTIELRIEMDSSGSGQWSGILFRFFRPYITLIDFFDRRRRHTRLPFSGFVTIGRQFCAAFGRQGMSHGTSGFSGIEKNSDQRSRPIGVPFQSISISELACCQIQRDGSVLCGVVCMGELNGFFLIIFSRFVSLCISF